MSTQDADTVILKVDEVEEQVATEPSLTENLKAQYDAQVARFSHTKTGAQIEEILQIINEHTPEPGETVEDSFRRKTEAGLTELTDTLVQRNSIDQKVTELDREITALQSPEAAKSEKAAYHASAERLIGLRTSVTASSKPKEIALQRIDNHTKTLSPDWDQIEVDVERPEEKESALSNRLKEKVDLQVANAQTEVHQEVEEARQIINNLKEEQSRKNSDLLRIEKELNQFSKDPNASSDEMPSVNELNDIITTYNELGSQIASISTNPYDRHTNNLDAQSYLANINNASARLRDMYANISSDTLNARRDLLYLAREMQQLTQTLIANIDLYHQTIPVGSKEDVQQYKRQLSWYGAVPGGKLFEIDNPNSKYYKGAAKIDQYVRAQRAVEDFNRDARSTMSKSPILDSILKLQVREVSQMFDIRIEPIQAIENSGILDQIDTAATTTQLRELKDEEVRPVITAYLRYEEAKDTTAKVTKLAEEKIALEGNLIALETEIARLSGITLERVKNDLQDPQRLREEVKGLKEQRDAMIAQLDRARRDLNLASTQVTHLEEAVKTANALTERYSQAHTTAEREAQRLRTQITAVEGQNTALESRNSAILNQFRAESNARQQVEKRLREAQDISDLRVAIARAKPIVITAAGILVKGESVEPPTLQEVMRTINTTNAEEVRTQLETAYSQYITQILLSNLSKQKLQALELFEDFTSLEAIERIFRRIDRRTVVYRGETSRDVYTVSDIITALDKSSSLYRGDEATITGSLGLRKAAKRILRI